MKLSSGYWQTYKDVPAEAEIPSHQLMLRAGLIQKCAGGLYNWLPVGLRTVRKIERIIRDELDRIGCFELQVPFVTPAELWQESGRWDVMGPEMLRVKDRSQRDLCLSPTNEESFCDIFRKTVQSYKQLPVTLYQINTKFRDEIRPRYGVMRCREFTMKDAYSFHEDKVCLDRVYDRMYQAYSNMFRRMGLAFIVVEADGGTMAGGQARTHEFQVIADSGEDRVIQCLSCGYAANIEKAETKKKPAELLQAREKMVKVSTPGKMTIEEVSTFLAISGHHCLKVLVYFAIKGQAATPTLAVLSGDDDLNEVKFAVAAGADHVKAATDDEIKKLGLIKGFIGPWAVPGNIKVIFDKGIDHDASYVTGAMEVDCHVKNFVPSRDATKGETADIRQAGFGDHCIRCGKDIVLKKGIEVGHIFQLGEKYTKAMNITILDRNGKAQTPIMGCYGIGIGRTMASAIEQHFDENGIVWPASIAPYHVHLCVVSKTDDLRVVGKELYEELWREGIETLYDDRQVGPGFMFKDADLLGLPLRVVIGERDFKQSGLVEIKVRKTGEMEKVPREVFIETIRRHLERLKNE
jgi:prolyl-tRNA synthetase